MEWKDIFDIVVIPVTLALLAILWPTVQSKSRRRTFQRLIIRERDEISPYPQQATENGWWMHHQKRFIHREIFEKVTENRDFILSLPPNTVYIVAQLWKALDEHNWDQWQYMLKEVNMKFVPGEEFADKRRAWDRLHQEYVDQARPDVAAKSESSMVER